jgi:lysozyme
MKTSAAGRKAITEREGLRLKAYQDSVGIWTIGVGHTSAAGPPTVVKGMKITAALADQILTRDLAIFEKAVNEAVTVPLSQNEFDALVSFAFNVGAGAFQKSTLLKELNGGHRYGAANEFLKWDKITVNGKKKVLKGLTIRRKAEREQFLSKADHSLPFPDFPLEPKQPAPKPAPKAGIAALIAAALLAAGAWFASLPCSLFGVLCQ